MIIIVKSKKDRDALTHVFRRVYRWEPRILTLSVEHRELNHAIEALEPRDFTLVLLGKEECRWVDVPDNVWKKIACFWKSHLRNGRMREIIEFFEMAKTLFVYDVRWENGVYILGDKTNFIERSEPGGDVFFLPEEWRRYRELLGKIVGREVGTPLIHTLRGTDVLYGGKKVIATVPRSGGKVVDHGGEPISLKRKDLLEKNKEFMREKVEVTMGKIREVLREEEVVVPLSGGKDSTVVAILLKVSGISFTPVFVDTGGEYPETLEYVDYLERIIGRVERVEAPVAKKYREKGEEYLFRRECTRDKITTLYEFVRNNFENPVLVNGDRIAESKARSFRPELRKDEFWVFSPIQLWSYLNEQLFLWEKGIKFNELYTRGFYRVGCSFCPFTDLLERISGKLS